MTNLITDTDLNNEDYIPNPEFLIDKKIQILEIEWLDQINTNKYKLQDGEDCIIYKPTFDTKQHSFTYRSPEVFLYELENLYIKVDGSNFHDNKKIIIERMEHLSINTCNYRAGNIIIHGEKKALVHKPQKAIQIDQPALFLGGNGSFNYYHLLLEIFVKLLIIPDSILKEKNINTLIINDKVKETKQFSQMLNAILSTKKTNFNLLYFNNTQHLYIKKPFITNSPNLTLFNSKKKLSSPAYCIYSMTALNTLRNKLLKLKSKPKSPSPEKIFLLRNPKYLSKHNQRSYNENEVFSFFKNKGYHGIFIEDYSFEEQIYVFNNAKEIAGPTGAFWANIIFCKEDTIAASWLNNNIDEFSCYSTLAKYFGCKLLFIKSKEENSKIMHGKYYLPTNLLASLYQNMNL